jgi:hypothetical protein
MHLHGKRCAISPGSIVHAHTRLSRIICLCLLNEICGEYLCRVFEHSFDQFLSKKEARQPHFPMEISDRTFELVYEHLNTLDFDGPVGLSCDDTKLFATYRLYWDAKESSYFLVGGTDCPLCVADPDDVKRVIEEAKGEKATKVNLTFFYFTSSCIVTYIDSDVNN